MLKSDKQQPFKIAYLVQCRKHWDYLFELQTDTTDLYVLTFKKPLRYPKGITSIYYPKSSWNTGRNKLYEVASQKDYDYYVFLDDDVVLDVHAKNWHPFRYLEACLNYYSPAAMAGNYDNISKIQKGKGLEFHTLKYHDACVSALHKDVAKKVLPYPTQWDKICWWKSQYYLCVLLGHYFPSSTIGIINLDVKNMMHEPYPNKQNDYEDTFIELQKLIGESENLLKWKDTINKNDGEFKPITFFQ
jgi:hypothetical protein